jgi:lipopolysaccharide export system permease protein
MSLRGFIMKTVALRVAGAAAILLGVLQILDLLEVTNDIVERGLGFGGIVHYAVLRLPHLIEQAAPLSMLAGGLFAFAQLARENAVTTFRAVGVSAYRLVAMAAPVAVAVMAIQILVTEVVAPRTDPMLQTWWAATAPAGKQVAPTPKAFRVGSDIVVATAGGQEGRRLAAVTVYQRDAAGAVTTRIRAPEALYRSGGWRFIKPQIKRFTPEGTLTSSADQMSWPMNLSPRDLQSLLSSDQDPSGASARRALAGAGSDRPQSYYAVRLQRVLAGPAGILVMLLLTIPVGLANFRTREGAVLTASALAAGLAFLVMDGLLSALGESAALSAPLAAWTAPIVFAALAGATLLKMEG